MDHLSLAETAYEHVCTDFPEVDQPRLDALCEALQHSLAKAPAPDYASHPICPRFVSGLAFGATRSPQPAPEGDLVGLAQPHAAPSRYAQVYAVGCILRTCSLLGAREADLQAGLAAYEVPVAEPAPEDVLEVSVPDELDSEEVWAAEPDDDECDYEALALPLSNGNGAALP